MARLEAELAALLRQCYLQPLEALDNAAPKSNSIFTGSVQQGLIADIVSTANLMFLADYGNEFCQTYIKIRREALEELLPPVLQIECKASSHGLMLSRWSQSFRILIRVGLAGERHLCDLVFLEAQRAVKESCFLDVSKSAVLKLLSNGKAIAGATREPNALNCLLGAYDLLNDLLEDVQHFFPGDCGLSVLTEYHEVLLRLKKSIIRTIEEVKNMIRTAETSEVLDKGEVHFLSKIVVFYVLVLSIRNRTLESVLENESPLAWHLKSLTSILVATLEHRSQVYGDSSLKIIFMMNNVRYLVETIKVVDIRNYFDDEWIHAHTAKIQMQALLYKQISWSPVLSFLRDERIGRPICSTDTSMAIVKGRFRGFNHALEEIYRRQTSWIVDDAALRADLRIDVCTHLIQAYRPFQGRHASLLGRYRKKYIKYSLEELEEFLLHLFEGSPKLLPSQRIGGITRTIRKMTSQFVFCSGNISLQPSHI